jgi:sugar lactone lactonase YvrE
MDSKIRSALAIKAIAGESPVWCAEEQALYWVDVMAPAVHRFHPESGRNETWALPATTGSIAVRERGGLVAATRSGFCFIDIPSGRATPIVNPEPDRRDNTFNDGRCDRRGRFWAGSSWFGPEGRYANPPSEPTGTIYRLDADRTCHAMVPGIGETNTILWSPDERTIYFGDSSKAAVIYAADWHAEPGMFENRRVFARTNDGHGIHDGSAMDAEGYLWTCFWEGWRIVRYAPDGRIDRIVELPVKSPTSCTFGGADLATLYITTACWYQSPDELKDQPWAGHVLAFEPGVRGLPDAKYVG